MFCDEVSQCVIKVCHKIQRKVHPLQRTTGQYSLSAAFLFFIFFSFSFEQQGVLVFNTDNRYLLPNLNKVFRLWFFSLQQGNNWFLNGGLRCDSGPVYFPRRGIWSSLHMLVLIRVWLLAGVSSPWLPSLGGDCERNERDQWEASRRAGKTDWGGNACWCWWRMTDEALSQGTEAHKISESLQFSHIFKQLASSRLPKCTKLVDWFNTKFQVQYKLSSIYSICGIMLI